MRFLFSSFQLLSFTLYYTELDYVLHTHAVHKISCSQQILHGSAKCIFDGARAILFERSEHNKNYFSTEALNIMRSYQLGKSQSLRCARWLAQVTKCISH